MAGVQKEIRLRGRGLPPSVYVVDPIAHSSNEQNRGEDPLRYEPPVLQHDHPGHYPRPDDDTIGQEGQRCKNAHRLKAVLWGNATSNGDESKGDDVAGEETNNQVGQWGDPQRVDTYPEDDNHLHQHRCCDACRQHQQPTKPTREPIHSAPSAPLDGDE